jgi:hypothetical protein
VPRDHRDDQQVRHEKTDRSDATKSVADAEYRTGHRCHGVLHMNDRPRSNARYSVKSTVEQEPSRSGQEREHRQQKDM